MKQDAKASGGPTFWDRTRQLAAQEILDTALRLFTEQGYEETTVAQIAHEAGVSQRTLFRYFGAKEDLIGPKKDELGELLRKTVEEQPADVSAWDALRAGWIAVLSSHATPEQAFKRLRLLFTTSSLYAGYLEKQLSWRTALLPAIETRMEKADERRLRAGAVIAAAFACADVACQTWVERDGQGSVTELFDLCLSTVRGAGRDHAKGR
ncbi:helix-turn-helix domain-containing protein [Streptomyces sp. NPDC051320]|uniref:TetR/AcrR family transcriptional regulator n=1 Tax=Streptomyces sp. NPDC051320 TaxID=3154644 RepID=UPI00342CFAB6